MIVSNPLKSEQNKDNQTASSLILILDEWDKRNSNRIHKLELPTWAEVVVYLAARLFNPDFILSYHILILFYHYYILSDLYFVLKPFIHTILCLFFTLFAKKLTARPRPLNNSTLRRLKDLRKFEKNCSMPSGDSLQSANFAIIIFCYFNSFLGFLLVPVVMFARIFYFCHYILDTVMGAISGLILSYYIYFLLN